ncbi:pyridoxal phosphate-dependent decarboxylase family protein [Haloactinomyces albus]|uniref:L-2,4-diaminobutyrate decarboxylase n=1 Tax=Haloactinomyces albus TaxID=1352928 RepID=A0AAE3ZHL2_9ACTN|nr:aspartate aminotransferase family protein [Haloactinomyces albus]MDR7304066.1 L-2,4-diaminobutyrate decarboxylase [Haloactinomyces albus]
MTSPPRRLSDHESPGTDGSEHLLNERNLRQYSASLHRCVERIAGTFAEVDRPHTGTSAAALGKRVSAIDLDEPVRDTTTALEELEEIYFRDAVYFHHPRYLSHLNCPVVIPAVAGEAILSAINSSLDTWDQSAGATLIEQRMIRWTADRIGLGDASDGVFTSGGTQSNLQALAIARDEAREAQSGTNHLGHTVPLSRLRVLTSECSHFSIAKSAALLGLDHDAVRSVPCDERRRMRVDALAEELARCSAEDAVVMAVVATAGTTDFGSIDSLHGIADLCAQYGVWLHVDAAYGCGLLVSSHRELLAGIERADSVTVDYHKSFFQPVSSSAILVRDTAHLRHITYHADYLNPADTDAERTPNQVDKSLQTTRRFDALKLWMTLRVLGPDALGGLFDEVLDRTSEARELLAADSRFELAAEPQLSTLVFRYVSTEEIDPELCDRMNRHARQALFDSGEAVVAGTTVNGRNHLKFTLLNPETSVNDISHVLDLLAEHAEEYLTGHVPQEFGHSRAS